jgi:hypothetical protein
VISGVIPYNWDLDTVIMPAGGLYVDGNLVTVAKTTAAIAGAPAGPAYPVLCLAFDITNPAPHIIQANSAYYIYYVLTAGQNSTFYASSIVPTEDGHPGANIQGSGAVGCVANATGSALFVGSFTTDPAKNMVPFFRNHDEVTVSQWTNTADTSFSVTFVTANGNQCITLNPSPLAFYPQSATAYIVTLGDFITTCAGQQEEAYLCAPNVTLYANCSNAANYLDVFYAPSSSVAASGTLDFRQYRIPIGTLSAPTFCSTPQAGGMCGADYLTFKGQFTGYVEKIARAAP